MAASMLEFLGMKSSGVSIIRGWKIREQRIVVVAGCGENLFAREQS